jgi:primase-polymerase (primpol)-like protein
METPAQRRGVPELPDGRRRALQPDRDVRALLEERRVSPAKPITVPVSSDGIPSVLRGQRRWCVWRWEWDAKKQKWRKPPYRVDLSRHASDKEPADWSSFEKALAVVRAGKADGIGYAFDWPLVGVDLDAELPEETRQDVISTLNSYTDRSPSGRGEHVVIQATLSGSGRHPEAFGAFQKHRWWYFTGEHVPGTPTRICDRQRELDLVLERYLPKPTPKATHWVSSPLQPIDIDDAILIEKARSTDPAFDALWRGDTSAQGGDHSRADLCLVAKLVFWFGRDPDAVDRAFRQSSLWRPKWDSRRPEDSTYGKNTIALAIAGARDVYEPRRSA